MKTVAVAALMIAVSVGFRLWGQPANSSPRILGDAATVFIYFLPGEGSKTFAANISIDGTTVVHLRKSVVFKTALNPGSHDFAVTGLSGKRYTFSLEPGRDTYLRLGYRTSAFGMYGRSLTRFELVTKQQAELDIAQGKLVPPNRKDLPKKRSD